MAKWPILTELTILTISLVLCITCETSWFRDLNYKKKQQQHFSKTANHYENKLPHGPGGVMSRGNVWGMRIV